MHYNFHQCVYINSKASGIKLKSLMRGGADIINNMKKESSRTVLYVGLPCSYTGCLTKLLGMTAKYDYKQKNYIAKQN